MRENKAMTLRALNIQLAQVDDKIALLRDALLRDALNDCRPEHQKKWMDRINVALEYRTKVKKKIKNNNEPK